MNNRNRLVVAVASMLPLVLGVVICCLLLATGAVATDVVSALAVAVIVYGLFTYIRLRRARPKRVG